MGYIRSFYKKVVSESRRKKLRAYQWRVEEIWGLGQGLRAIGLYKKYLEELKAYQKLPGAEKIDPVDLWPCLFDKTETSPMDKHYFYQAAWASRRIIQTAPTRHFDIGSQLDLIGILSASIPIIFLDIRPLIVSLSNVQSLAGSILNLPFLDNSISSLSCLHVIEHIGLGRYGDPFDPMGTRKAAQELVRVLKPGGSLFLSLPIGRERLCFNAHRIHSPQTALDYFADLHLKEFSCEDDGKLLENVDPYHFEKSNYACGLFWFIKNKSKNN